MAIDELYLENLDEFVNDENKVVTYKWLSRAIGVHVNQAKQMLHTFVQLQRNQKDNDSLSVLYLLAGTITPEKDDAGPTHQVSLVPEEGLDAAKARLEAVTSCHVYSVQRSKLKDTNSLYTADYDLLRENLSNTAQHSAIQCAAACRRTDQELQGLRQKGAEAYAPTYNAKSKSTNGQAKKTQQNAIGSMFNKASKKEPAPKPQEKAAPKSVDKQSDAPPKESKAAKETKKGGALASMFAKQAAKPKPEPKLEPKPEPKKVEEKMEVEEEKPRKASPEVRKTKSVKSKKDADRHAEENGKSNKRRRIKEVVSSSSEDEVDIEEVPPTPPREPSPEPEPILVESEEEAPAPAEKQQPVTNTTTRRRKRRRKHVDKTYLDDDGFMVTEKVWESESTDASDIEEPKAKVAPKPKEPTKAPVEKTTKKKASPNKATGKQTSLMNFFKKK